MKNIKRKLTAIIMTGFLMAGTTFAKDGFLMSDLTGGNQPQTCTQTNDSTGIIIAGFTGIIIAGFTGILISDFTSTKSTCEQ